MFNGWNEKHFTLLYAVITIGVVYLASILPYPALRIFGSSAQSVALWLASNIGLIYFLNGVGCDVHEEITKQHNTALGIMIGMYGIALAIVIHG